MKVKILKSSGWYKGLEFNEFEVDRYLLTSPVDLRFSAFNHGWIYSCDCVITELPESFCVKRCDDKEKWEKYIQWLNKTYKSEFDGNHWEYYGIWGNGFYCNDILFGIKIHIDDMIKHIDYMERHIKGGEQFSKESQLTVKMDKEFDLTTNEGRLAYAKKHYPIGTKYIALDSNGVVYKDAAPISEIVISPKHYGSGIEGGFAYIYANGKWAEIIKEEINMETQKLSRQGLKEIHGVACPNWKDVLEHYGSRNPLEDYIELTQQEVNQMFDACTEDQLPIVSKYLKEDNRLFDFNKVRGTIQRPDGQELIGKRVFGKFDNKSFYLHKDYDWEIKKDDLGELCLIPTKKK